VATPDVPGADVTGTREGVARTGAARAFPLAGTRVLDFSRVVAGPFASRMLADLGADVVKVEPPEGDISRRWGRQVAGIGGAFTQQNAGKRSICIDLGQPGSRELVLRLAARADIVIENFRPGVMEKFGLAWDDLRQVNPRLVMLSISGFGQDGPERDRASYAPIIHAETGLLDRQAHLDAEPPNDFALSLADTLSALHGLVGLLAAYRQASLTGAGEHVDLAMVRAMVASDDSAISILDGQPIVRPGNRIFDAVGGPIIIAGDEKWLWHQLSRHCGLVDPSPTDADLAAKIAARRDTIEAFLVSCPDRATLVAHLDAANLAWGDVHPHREAYQRQRTIATQGVITTVDDRDGGTRPVTESPYRFSSSRAAVQGPAAFLGEHHHEVLSDWLDLGAAEIDELEGCGVLRRGPTR
jgi:crotonobetainyl-CoA:carnitine CoA-transferase CaiB-like acyl-CoA transferase